MRSNYSKLFLLSFLLPLFPLSADAQIGIGNSNNSPGLSDGGVSRTPDRPTDYTIGGITVTGTKYLDEDLLLAVSGLTVGGRVRLPHDESIAKAIRNLWKQDLFANVAVQITSVVGNKVFLNIAVEERPRLSKYNFKGITKSEATEVKNKLNLVNNKVVTEAMKKDAEVRTRQYFVDKGYGNATVQVSERADSSRPNTVILTFNINKGYKTRINQVNIAGNEFASESRLKRTFRGTKEMTRLTLHPEYDQSVYGNNDGENKNYWRELGFLTPTRTLDKLDPYFRFRLFSSSKFNENKFEEDKQSLIAYYNSIGFRDAAIAADTVYAVGNGHLNVDLKVNEGRRYYFGDITFRGNTKYSTEELNRRLGIEKGDIYNQQLLDSRIGRGFSEAGDDIGSLYMDDGYLFFNIDPVETSIIGDTINYELRITEGQQATIGKVNIYGNDRTNEHVIRRELRTMPGNKFSRADLIRSQREIANLGFFDAEKIGIQPIPHPETGTVDIDYTVAEKSSDQLQLSAGFGGGIRFYGNVGIVFNNFSVRNILKPRTWDPLPIGDGQKFSVNLQSNGVYYTAFNASFTEPWLGGRKPNALTTNFIYSKYSGSYTGDGQTAPKSYLKVIGGGVSLSKRLQWPDDNFVLTYGLNYQRYNLKDFALIDNFNNGISNNLFAKVVLARYSVDQPIYPTSGSNISLSFQFTPPYSTFNEKDYSGENSSEKYKWIEYHKYRFTAEWYQRITGKFVFKLSTKYGFLGYYNKNIGFSPFERFQVGGDGLQGQNYFVGRDIISQRGYEVYAENATIFNKYTAEIRYPFSLSPTSTIYGLVFADAANGWNNFKEYNPFKLNRDAGVGVRVFLPMFGMLGLDYGVGFDRYNKATGNTRFKDMARFTFMLGFEPD